MATILRETAHRAEFISCESPGGLSRTIGATLASGNDLDTGTVLGRRTTNAATIAAQAGNTGDAALTSVSVTVKADAEHGPYILRCTNAGTANAEVFSVQTPGGKLLASATAGVAYTSGTHINLTIPNNGTTDWAVGDVLIVTVGDGKWTALDPDATSGAQIAQGILYAAVDATSADAPCTVIEYQADVNDQEIVWPAGITASEKAVAIQQLAARRIRLFTGNAITAAT